MVINEEQATIFRLLDENGYVTVNGLIEKGFTCYRINILVAEGLLIPLAQETYTLADQTEFARYKSFIEAGKDLLVLSEEIHKIYDTLLEFGTLNLALLTQAELSNSNIKRLLAMGILKKSKTSFGEFELTDTTEYTRYCAMALKEPTITSSPKIQNHMNELLKIYDLLIEGSAITPETLKRIGIDEPIISNLIRDRILLEDDHKNLSLADYRRFFIYGNYLKENGRHEESARCYETCYRLDKRRQIFGYFTESLLLEDYDLALKRLSFLQDAKDTPYTKDYNFYLFLMSFILVLPPSLNKCARTLKMTDIESPQDIAYIPNEIKALVFAKKFKSALDYIAKRYKHEAIPSEVARIRRVLKSIEKNQSELRCRILRCIELRNVDALHIQLSCEQRARKLESPYNYLLMLASDIKKMRADHKSLPSEHPQKNTMPEYIRTKNYIEAYSKCIELAFEKGIEDKNNHIGILLELALEELVRCGEPLIRMLTSMLTFLENGKEKATLKILRTYLSIYGHSEYYEVIGKLLNIGILTGDSSCNEAIVVLTEITTGAISLPISSYAENARTALQAGASQVAELYIAIIEDSLNLHHSDIDAKEVHDILQSLKDCSEPKPEVPKNFTNRPIKNSNDQAQ